ncbi:hypothetical protein ACFQ9X_49285 [Catenulispora yoronensis]
MVVVDAVLHPADTGRADRRGPRREVGAQAKRNILAADGARTGAGLADVARLLGLADLAILAYLIFHYYFIAHAGIGGVMTLLLT